jgi:hypothetical protein
VVERFLPALVVSSDEIGATTKIKEEGEMKRIVFLIVASLLVLGLVLPGTVGANATTIEVIIAGPMGYQEGQDMWNGATLANTTIGTITHGSDQYVFHLNQVDTNEIANPAGAAAILGSNLTSTGAKIVIGGYRSDAVDAMIPVAISHNALFFICGAALYGLLSDAYSYNSGWQYDEGYKYIFRGTPFNDVFLENNAIMWLGMVTSYIKKRYDITPKVAIFAEGLWANTIVEMAKNAIQTELGCELGPVERVSNNAAPNEVEDALTAIKNAHCHVIFTVLAGPVGVTYGYWKAKLDVPAISVGINVEAQDPGYWNKTYCSGKYGAEDEITLATWANGTAQTSKTGPFLTAFQNKYHHFPTFTAASYDVLWGLAKAIEAVGYDPNDLDPIIEWYEDMNNVQVTTTGNATYYPQWDSSTTGMWQATGPWPALNSTQLNQIYGVGGYNASCNFTMPPYTTHDLIYGPDYSTGIAIQWQSGKQVS